MKRNIVLLFLACFFSLEGFSQSNTITGTVMNSENNTPLSSVTVRVKGKSTGVITNTNGRYSINASPTDVLEFISIGYNTVERNVGFDKEINVVMSAAADNDMGEVVVVAMDQKRNPRSLSYSVQTVGGDEIKESQRENFVNSMQGRVAGLTVNPTSGTAGASTQLVLRGFNSLSLDNTPLFVVDGVIMDNSSLSTTSGSTALTSATENRSEDFSSRISDINPNDIASVTILKGPEATALYGSQASSGAIVITTKKSMSGKGIRINYDNSFRISRLTRFPQTISLYSTGSNGIKQNVFTSFGPRYADTVQIFENDKNFFKTGFAQTHNLSLGFGSDKSSFRVSGSTFNNDGFIPANNYNRYNLRISNTTKLAKWIDIMPAISYVNTTNKKVLRGASGYLLNLLVWPADDDIRDYQTADGLKKPLFNENPNGEIDNPFYNVYKNPGEDKTNRVTGTLGVNLRPFDWLEVSGRFGYDYYRTEGYLRYDSMSYYTTRAQKGLQRNYYHNYYGYNHTITATGTKEFGRLSTRLMVGTMWQDYETQIWSVSGTNLKSQFNTDSSNTDPSTRTYSFNMQFRDGKPNYTIRRQLAYFGEAVIGWNNAIFLTYSHRFETNSIFPAHSRNYNYPAGGVSIILSDLVPGFKNQKAVEYWKIRTSVANTARSASPYANQSLFNANLGSGGGFYYDFTNANPDLSPERQSTYELGTEVRAFKNRINFDFTYYNTTNKNLIVEKFRASYGTGFVLNTLNVGSTNNQGVEIVLATDVIKNKDLLWNTKFNFNKMWNKILALPSNVPEFYISDTWLYGNARGGGSVGLPTTTLTSYGYLRNNNGDILIDPSTGIPVIDATFKVRGDRNADFTLGWVNYVSYKNFAFSMLWDLKIGGDIFNATEMYLTRMGRSLRTADRGKPLIVDGVLRDGLENTATPTKNIIVVNPYHQNTYYTTMPEEEFIQKDVNWFRLREITLAYNFTKQQLQFWNAIKSLSAFVTVTDPLIFTNYRGADPQVNGTSTGSAGVGAFGFDYGNVGMPVGINIGLRTSF
ncbi:SusC/RagA family TonB-linked outer membrane protein [Haoranjiania flava]|uniref:SusC/RagA family TonB-linked outer membrane protein n=2 Tax=Haoranjiania flava TaxID=1856322 RepID=A0AAE3LKL3_9BACT|nr:SusC/RagA family TonB-linked outer membrane protein [Haoranjiania flava]MCU7694693.1 SusC/RagA family TonB-linked outer membrane protein [Haoranjiania flava]